MQLRSIRMGILAALAAVLGLCGPASAQFFGGTNSWNNPPVSQREFDLMVKMLAFDEVQEEIAADMFGVLEAEFGEMAAVAREMSEGAREEFQRSRDPAVWRELGERLSGFEDKRTAMGDQFWSDVKILLTDEQLPLWDKFERRRFRGRAISRQEQVLSGVGVDLVVLTEEMELSEEEKEVLPEVIEQYEVELDRKLRAYRRIADEQQAKAEEIGREGNWMQNMDKYNEIFAAVRDELLQVRAIHERYLKTIATRLDEESAAELTDRFNRAAYPDIYRDTYVDNGIEQALAMESLTPEQREFVVGLKEGFDRESNRLREVLVRTQREREENMRLQDMWGGQRDTVTREAQNELREFQLRMYDELLKVLTEEQKAGLPERPATDWRERSFDF